MMKLNYSIGLLGLILILSACSKSQIHYQKSDVNWKTVASVPSSDLLYSLYLIGDAGDDTLNSRFVIGGLKNQLDQGSEDQSGVVFLGDNIYPEGLRKKNHKYRKEDENRLNIQLDAIKDFKGEVVFIPGNHDWDRQGEDGLKQIKRQEEYVQDYLDRGNVFLPSHGCPGPEVVKLTPGLVMIIIDTQWWVHQFERASGEKDGCEVRDEDELMVLFKDLLKKYRNQNVVVVGHHPLYSNGEHGGHFTFKDHLFPLTAIHHDKYIPFPIIGSIYPLYRKFLGHPQDITHPTYQDMKNKLVKAMNEYENVIYVCGHEHNLQYTKEKHIHHVISGAGSKVTHVKFDKKLAFGAMQKGYSKINYYENGEIWLEFYVIDPSTDLESLGYRKLLFQRDVDRNEEPIGVIQKSYQGQFKTLTPDSSLAAGRLKKVFFGELNREIWATPVKVPYLDIHFVKGGLSPIKKGGGLQTLSLRMKGEDGKEYSLRGIKKNATFLTEKDLRGTIAQDLIYDGMAGSHPYASLAIPMLSEAVGVYHANPELVYVPDDAVLGDYQEEFGGMFCLFEERPDADMSKFDSFGNSKNVMGYSDAIHKMHNHHDHVVDKDYIVKARLFDMLIGDWDRHDDQWRWASFKEKGTTIYRPIPRDRDQAFFEFDGLFYKIANRKWLLRKFQPFDDDVRDIYGLSFNARYFDRSFLIEATKEDWIKAAEHIRTKLTDEIIKESINQLPKEGFDLTGEEIIATLIARRDNLLAFANEAYGILAKEVSIPGTLKDDFFEVIRYDDGSVEVNVYPRKKGQKVKKKRFYHRIFNKEETDEIRLYGLEGNDEYKIEGKVKKSILVRIVSGFQKDNIEDKSRVNGLKKMTIVYETKGKNKLKSKGETKMISLPEKEAFDYDRKDFKKNKLAPKLSIGYNPNDGFYIGPGFKYVAHGFKKEPYKYYHQVLLNRAFGSNGYNLYYEFDYIDIIGKFDVAGEFAYNAPLVYQYYGAGNQTKAVFDENNPGFFDVRMENFHFKPNLKLVSKSQSQKLTLSFDFQRVNFENSDFFDAIGVETQSQDYIGSSLKYSFSNVDNKINPNRGLRFSAGATWTASANNSDVDFYQVGTELSLYLPVTFVKKQVTIGLRSGVYSNIGDYSFFQANFLSGFENFRGVLRNRYAGETSQFNNLDLRISLFKVRNYIAPFDFGIVGHGDVARVWEENESSELWHSSYGGGAFVNILDSFMLQGTYSISDSDRLFTIGTQFFF